MPSADQAFQMPSTLPNPDWVTVIAGMLNKGMGVNF